LPPILVQVVSPELSRLCADFISSYSIPASLKVYEIYGARPITLIIFNGCDDHYYNFAQYVGDTGAFLITLPCAFWVK
jgi:hypothetical protein